MTEERFKYLNNTLPWNLKNQAEVEEQAEVNKVIIPFLLGKLLSEYADNCKPNNDG